MRHITHMNLSCHIYTKESCQNKWVMSHIWRSPVTYVNELWFEQYNRRLIDPYPHVHVDLLCLCHKHYPFSLSLLHSLLCTANIHIANMRSTNIYITHMCDTHMHCLHMYYTNINCAHPRPFYMNDKLMYCKHAYSKCPLSLSLYEVKAYKFRTFACLYIYIWHTSTYKSVAIFRKTHHTCTAHMYTSEHKPRSLPGRFPLNYYQPPHPPSNVTCAGSGEQVTSFWRDTLHHSPVESWSHRMAWCGVECSQGDPAVSMCVCVFERAWLIHMQDTTPSYTGHHLFLRDTTQFHARPDSFMNIQHIIDICSYSKS